MNVDVQLVGTDENEEKIIVTILTTPFVPPFYLLQLAHQQARSNYGTSPQPHKGHSSNTLLEVCTH